MVFDDSFNHEVWSEDPQGKPCGSFKPCPNPSVPCATGDNHFSGIGPTANETLGIRAVLFADFERPVRFPFNLLNKLVLKLAVITPYIREADQNQKAWEHKFYARR
jgi:hypothetical protein